MYLIGGYADAVVDGVTGLLAEPGQLLPALDRALTDDGLRSRLAAAALERARSLTWEATALGTLQVLADDALRRRR